MGVTLKTLSRLWHARRERKPRVTQEEQVELQRLGLTTPADDAHSSTRQAVAPRVVQLNPGPGAPSRKFSTNSVHTAKYNPVTFLPRYLFEQFTQIAYLYFLIQACLVWWSTVSPFKPFGPVLALCFVLVVGAIKAITEDRRRHIEDSSLNNSITHVLQPDGSVVDTKWRDVKVGDLLKVNQDEDIPADLLCLYCDLEENMCYIKTTGLDGETNLKVRRPLDAKKASPKTVADAIVLRAMLACEPPNSNLHYFVGRCVVQSGSASQTVAVTMNEVLLRGCTLKNSRFVIGLVIYTGPETRIQMNAAAPPRKQGSYTSFLNMQVFIIIVLQLLLCALCSMGALLWRENKGKDRYYLALDNSAQGNYKSNVAFYFVYLITFWLLFSYLVPISLFVTLEIVKYLQGKFVSADPEMKPANSPDWAKTRNSNIIEDLGRVSYVFSDKTGTLTSNEMRLRAVAIKGTSYGSSDFRLEDFEGGPDDALRAFAPGLHSAAAVLREAGFWDESLRRGGSSPSLLQLARTDSSTPPERLGLSPPNKQVSSRQLVVGHHVMDFWTAICVCHNLIVENVPESEASSPVESQDGSLPSSVSSEGSEGEPLSRFQGPSPDEVALVEGARQLGFEFVSRTHKHVLICFQGQKVMHEILAELEFSSERARMSVVARAPDGTIRLLCKGSDAAMLRRLRPGTDAKVLAGTEANLHAFSVKGLRTLVIAAKVLSEEEWHSWQGVYAAAAASLDDREERIAAAAEQLEVDLELLGVTAIEDKLQDGVPEAVETLIQGGMRVWMITGDKQETAINIAISAGLVSNGSRCLICNASGTDGAHGRLRELREQMHREYGKFQQQSPMQDNSIHDSALSAASRPEGKTVQGYDSKPYTSPAQPGPEAPRNGLAANGSPGPSRPEFVVDGATLGYILGTSAEAQLAEIVAECAAVVVCRASPSQKAAVVRMMRRHELVQSELGARGFFGRQLRRYKHQMGDKMLAIGDGANDVAMIQTADIGVGIMGKEGRQAVNNSDFAIAQFRFLVRLLMVHGSLSVYRLSRLIRYSFYKNIALAFLLFFYQGYAGWSGQTLLDGITTSFYNAFFTAFPIAIFAVVDRPFKNLTTYIRFPRMYNTNNPLTVRTFWKTGVVMAICHAAVVFFVIYYSAVASDNSSLHDVFAVGKVMFVALITIVTAEMGLIARYWTWEFCIVTFLSYAAVYAFLFVLPALQMAFNSPDVTTYGMGQLLFSSSLFWLQIIAVTALCTGSRYLDRALRNAFYPNDQQIVAEAEKLPHGGAPASAQRLVRLSSQPSDPLPHRSSGSRRRSRFSQEAPQPTKRYPTAAITPIRSPTTDRDAEV